VAGSRLPRLESSVPARLRQLTVVVAVLGLLAAGAGYATFASRTAALQEARSHTDQLVVLQSIRTDLVAADATATNSFLLGGVEPGRARSEYLGRLDSAARALSRAGSQASDPESVASLAAVTSAVTRYAGLVESARANNRQGYPIGAGYLKNASATLRADALAKLAELSTRDEAAVTQAAARSTTGPLLWLLAGVLALLVVGQRWLTRVTRRILNLGMITASVLVVVLLIGSYVVFAWTATTLDDAARTSYTATVQLSRARIDAFDAKANESLTLISRGTGQSFEKAYAAAMVRAQAEARAAGDVGAGTATLETLTAWAAVHRRITGLDDEGDWDDAVALATDPYQSGTSPRVFDVFDRTSGEALAQASAEATQQFAAPLTALGLGGLLAALVGLASAVAAWRGLAPRIEEYV
jgi:hypothetical protein